MIVPAVSGLDELCIYSRDGDILFCLVDANAILFLASPMTFGVTCM